MQTTLRNVEREIRSKSPLTQDQLRAVAPSIFAPAAHDSRSARYTYIPTIDVVEALRAEGFEPFYAAQSRTRDLERRDYTRHMLRLRHVDQVARAVGDEIPEIALINSHDGTSSYQMYAGLFRLVCTNGLLVGSSTLNEIRVPHSGDVVGRVIEGAFSVVKEFDRIQDNAASMKAIELSDGEARAFGNAALVAKYGERPAYPVSADQVLGQRRWDDRRTDLWSTFNRVQENLIRGGLRGRTATGRRQRTRAIQGITENVQLNRALWTLADQMKQLKLAA
jgi:hypothetical protein